MSRTILILGATSSIAEQYARLEAARGSRLLLAGRNAEHLAAIAADLTARGAGAVSQFALDLAQPPQGFQPAFDAMTADGPVDVVLIAYGQLGDQKACEQDAAETLRQLSVNMTSACLWAGCAAAYLEGRGQGTVAAISSVAGDRGRRSNYVYGAAKAGLSAFMAGLAHRFAGTRVHAVCIKPGFVDTPMTAAVKKGGPLWATPAKVAADMDAAIRAGKPVIYTPWFWAIVMLVIRNLPLPIFNKMKI